MLLLLLTETTYCFIQTTDCLSDILLYKCEKITCCYKIHCIVFAETALDSIKSNTSNQGFVFIK